MLADATLDVEVARGVHLAAHVGVPNDARGVVACLGEHPEVAGACVERGFAAVQIDVPVVPVEVDKAAAVFSAAISAITNDASLRDRPVGYFGTSTGGVAALIAASMHSNDVKAVVTLDAPIALMGAHMSGVRAATLFLVDGHDDELLRRHRDDMPRLPDGSMLVQVVPEDATDAAGAAAEWFDRNLRGLMRGARRDLWRSA